MKPTRFNRFATLATLAVLPGCLFAADRVRNITTNNLIADEAWEPATAPTSSDRAVWNATSVGGATTLGGDASWGGILVSSATPASGPSFTNAVNPSAFTLTLGASGIDLNDGGLTNRGITFESNTKLDLSANQTWKLGLGQSSANITASSVISGIGSLEITRDALASNYAYLNAANTFSGGVILGAGSALRLGAAAPTFASNLPTASVIGTGDLTIGGGLIFGGGGTIAPAGITVNSDFGVNLGTSSLNGRFTIAGGIMNLGGETRTVSLGRYDTPDAVGGVLQGGFESLRFLQTVGAPLISIQGTLRLARESGSSPTVSDYVSVTFSTGSNFTAGAGLTVGDHVITTMGTGNPFGPTAGAQPIVTVESGGYFNMSDAAYARSPFIRSLAGAGTVTSFSSNGAQSSTLTINPQDGDVATFSGGIVDGSTLTAVVSTAASPVILSKTGAGTQILSGNNNYSGVTTISAGMLKFAKQVSLYNNTPASWTDAKIVVNSGGILAFNVGGTGEFTSSDIASLSALGTADSGFKTGSKLGLDTTNAGGTFTYSNVLANPNAGANALGLRKIGAGTLVLDQVNTYTGGSIVEGGAIKIVQPGGIAGGSLVLNPGTSFEADFSALVAAGQVTNTTTGGGTINATPPNASQLSFTSGALSGFAGTINVKPSPASSGRVDFNGLIGTGSTLKIESGATARLVNSGTYGGVTVNVSGTGGSGPGALRLENGTLDSSCAVNLLSNASIGGFTITSTVDAIIADGGNGYSLTKSGDSTLVLTAANTYTGGTNVNGGTLRISKPYLANSSAVVIGSTAVLDLNFDETNGQVSDTVGTLTIGNTQMAAGTYGATGSGATFIDDDRFAGIGTLTVTTGPSSGNYASWAIANGISGQPFHTDFDNDGISNGVEYALGKSPTVSSQPAGILSNNTITFTKGADALANNDVSWIIETSTTLAAGSWIDEVVQLPTDNTATISYTFTPGTPVKKFARLKVVQVTP